MATFTGRTYPGAVGEIYKNTQSIHDISNLSVSQGGSPGVGNTTSAQLSFIKTLMDNNMGKLFYLRNTGNGYDTHSNELI